MYEYLPLNSFCTAARNIAPRQGGITANAASEVSGLTAEMIAGSDKGSNTDPFADLDEALY